MRINDEKNAVSCRSNIFGDFYVLKCVDETFVVKCKLKLQPDDGGRFRPVREVEYYPAGTREEADSIVEREATKHKRYNETMVRS